MSAMEIGNLSLKSFCWKRKLQWILCSMTKKIDKNNLFCLKYYYHYTTYMLYVCRVGSEEGN